MSNVYLKYSFLSGGTLTTSNAQTYDALKYYDKIEVERKDGRSLKGIDYNHLVGSRKVHNITISQNELSDSTKLTFIENFFKGIAWQLSTDGNTYTNVVLKEKDVMPYEYIENMNSMKELPITLTQKERD